MASTIEEAKFWINELRDLSPETRYLIWKQLPDQLGSDSYEKLIANEWYDEDDEVTYANFECPHCHETIEYHEIDIVDHMVRESEFTDYSSEDMTLEASYGSGDDFLGIAYECQNCHAPVSLPAGWKET